MASQVDIKPTQPSSPYGLWVFLITVAIGGFIWSGRSIYDCVLITGGSALTAWGVWLVCQFCRMQNIVSTATAIIFTFSPYITQLAVLNPFLPLIIAAGIWAMIPWVSCLSDESNLFNISFVLVLLPPALFVVLFSLLANPSFMDSLSLATFFPLPISEQPFPSLAKFSAPSYSEGIPVAASYAMLIFCVPGLVRLPFVAVLVCLFCGFITFGAFEKPILQTPPAIWAIFSILAISILSANGIGNVAKILEKITRIRRFWIFAIAMVEIFVIAYILTY